MQRDYEKEIDNLKVDIDILKGELDATTRALQVIVFWLTLEKYNLRADIINDIEEEPINALLLFRENKNRMYGFRKFKERLTKVMNMRP